MADSPTQANRQISLTTPLGTDVLLLRSFTIEEELAKPFLLTMECQSTSNDIDFTSIIGQNVTVNVNLPTYQQRYFNGSVASFKQIGFVGDLTNYRLTVRPDVWFLSKTSGCQIYQNLSAPSIIQSVLSAAQIAFSMPFPASAFPTLEYCVQYNETSLDFVNRLIEANGLFYYFQHTASSNTMVICESVPASNPFPGYEVIPYSRERNLHNTSEHIYEWQIEQQVESGGYMVNSYNYLTPKVNLAESQTVTQTYKGGSMSRYTYTGVYTTSDEGSSLANIRLQEQLTEQAFQVGVSNALGIASGCTFMLSGYPRTDQCVEQFTTRMTLRITSASFEAADQSDPDFEATCDFSTIPASGFFRPACLTPRPRIAGPQTATVMSPTSGLTFDADTYGSIYVKFHWDQSTGSNASTCRIRVAQNSADPSSNSMFIPQVGSEVIVSFEDGNPDAPIVMGRVYNADIAPAPSPTSSPYVSYFGNATASNLLSMDATPNANQVVLKNSNNSITMNSTTGAQKMVLTDGQSTITFDPNAKTVTTVTPGDQDTTNEANTNAWTWGDWSEYIFGLKVSNVFGVAWNFYLGAYTKFIVGAELAMDCGGKLELIFPFGLKITRGWHYKDAVAETNIHTFLGYKAAPAEVKIVGQKTTVVEGSKVGVAGDITETGLAKVSTLVSQTTTTTADYIVSSTGMCSLYGTSVLVSGPEIAMVGLGDVNISGAAVMVNGAVVELG